MKLFLSKGYTQFICGEKSISKAELLFLSFTAEDGIECLCPKGKQVCMGMECICRKK
jgi:hypothetical protein